MLVSVTSPIVPLERGDPVFQWAVPLLLGQGATTFTIFGVPAADSLVSVVLLTLAFLSLAPTAFQLIGAVPQAQDALSTP